MEKVLGIGGLFFRADNPTELASWYAQHLGIDVVPKDYDTPCWQQAGGSTVFAPFDANTDYFGRKEQQWMINFRVRDLDAMAAQLRAAGIAVDVDETVQPNGRFARLNDPAGNPIELWEPADEKDRREP
ncbi:MAG: VOC family protein [Alphaproteobacteria bacterium]|nr:VOC family protein [Alphaproteobacteria bacterium]